LDLLDYAARFGSTFLLLIKFSVGCSAGFVRGRLLRFWNQDSVLSHIQTCKFLKTWKV